jgi:phosphoserine phosphatase
MIGAAGLGVAFVAKPHVQKQAQFHVNHVDLTPLLFYMGVSRAEAILLLKTR